MRNPIYRTGLALLSIVALSVTVHAGLVGTVPMQGRLTDAAGDPVSNGDYMLVFTVWDAPIGGTQLWSEAQVVSAKQGNFSVYLGSTNPIGLDVFFGGVGNDVQTYLQIKIESDPPISPRMFIGSSPLALTAARLDGDFVRTDAGEAQFQGAGNDFLIVIVCEPGLDEASIRLQKESGSEIPIEMVSNAVRSRARVAAPGVAQLPAVQIDADASGASMTFFADVLPVVGTSMRDGAMGADAAMVGTGMVTVHADGTAGGVLLADPRPSPSKMDLVLITDADKSQIAFGDALDATTILDAVMTLSADETGGDISLFPPLGGVASVAGRDLPGSWAAGGASVPFVEISSDNSGGSISLIGDSPLSPQIDLVADPSGGRVSLIGSSPLSTKAELTADGQGGKVSLLGGSPLNAKIEMAADDNGPWLRFFAGDRDVFGIDADTESVCLQFLLPGPPGPPSWGLCANFSQGNMNMIVPALNILPPGPVTPGVALRDAADNPRVTLSETMIEIRDAATDFHTQLLPGSVNVYDAAGNIGVILTAAGISGPKAAFGSSLTINGADAFAAGANNNATGDRSVAMGNSATAAHDGAFVWNDDSKTTLSSDIANQFKARASGGFVFLSDVGTTAGARLSKGSSIWQTLSDRNAKRNLRPVDPHVVLAQLLELQVQRWSYKTQDPSIEHMGPTAQDFYALYGLGEDDRHVTSLDLASGALAGVQALATSLAELDQRTAELENSRAQLSRQNRMLRILEGRLAVLEESLLSMGEEDGLKLSSIR